MTTITPNNKSSSKKRAEILRLQQLMRAKKLKAADLAKITAVSRRTIENTIWKNEEIGARLLRALYLNLGVSLDWLLGGIGHMWVNQDGVSDDNGAVHEEGNAYACDTDDEEDRRPLIHFYEHADYNTLQDFWYLAAMAAERSLLQSGAAPYDDYSRIDLYRLVQPFVLEQFSQGKLSLLVSE